MAGEAVASVGRPTPSPTALSPEGPANSPLDQESCFLSGDEEAPLGEPGPATGYFPCYRTCAELPPQQPSGNGVPPRGDVEKPPGRAREEAETLVGRGGGRGKGPGTHPAKDAPPGEPPGGQPGGSRPKEEEGGRDQPGHERPPKPRRPGSSPSQPSVSPGVSEEAPGSGPPRGQPPGPLCGRRSAPKRPRKSCRPGDEDPGQGKAELRRTCSDQRPLLDSLEEKRGGPQHPPPSRTGPGTSGGDSEDPAEAEAGEGSRPQTPPLQGGPSAGSPPDPHPSPSRRSVRSVLSRARNLFCTPPPAQEPPTTSAGGEAGPRKSAHHHRGLRAWAARHRAQVHPLPC